jgi:oxalate decarboxylase/phosphoglucose isomerase-like protein (cupin superfamily)
MILYTDMRISAVELTIPPFTNGPPPHWHEMHDETFLVTAGTVRFHIPGKPDVDAKAGDYVVVPTRSPHTFSNPTDQEAKFFNTFTPAFYINYFKLLSELAEAGQPMTKEVNQKAMTYYATIPVPQP